MKVKLHKISIRDLVKNYVDNHEAGVIGYGGRLNIRPPYQREFVYKDKQRNAVIETVQKGFPLNIMYWVKNDDGYEVLDGQQRTISICQYVTGEFSMNRLFFHNQPDDLQEKILDYPMMIYFCEGKTSEKLDWFRTVNIAGERLYEQELRNAVFTGPWLADAKLTFSKTGCAAYGLGSKYVTGSPIRQEYLETAIDWFTDGQEGQIEDYMGRNQRAENANELWEYFQAVIHWVEATFPNYRSEMKGVCWGYLYNRFKSNSFDTSALEERITNLMMDDDVTNKKGIYEYTLTGEECHLNIRAFSPAMKRTAYERQNGICQNCGQHFPIEKMEGDHITPWHDGGKTTPENCQMLCKDCNRRKSGK